MLTLDFLKFLVLKNSDYKGNITTARRRFVATICEDKETRWRKSNFRSPSRKAEDQRPTSVSIFSLILCS